MRSLRVYSNWPREHADWEYVDFDNADYIIRHFGGLPHCNNGISGKTERRCGKVLTSPEETYPWKCNPNDWWGIKGGNRAAFESIPFDEIVWMSTTRMIKDTLVFLYEKYKNS